MQSQTQNLVTHHPLFILFYLKHDKYAFCLCRDSTQDLFMVMGALYSAVLFLGTNNASSVQPIISIERTVFYRERAAGMYSPLPYAFAQVSRAFSPNFFHL